MQCRALWCMSTLFLSKFCVVNHSGATKSGEGTVVPGAAGNGVQNSLTKNILSLAPVSLIEFADWAYRNKLLLFSCQLVEASVIPFHGFVWHFTFRPCMPSAPRPKKLGCTLFLLPPGTENCSYTTSEPVSHTHWLLSVSCWMISKMGVCDAARPPGQHSFHSLWTLFQIDLTVSTIHCMHWSICIAESLRDIFVVGVNLLPVSSTHCMMCL